MPSTIAVLWVVIVLIFTKNWADRFPLTWAVVLYAYGAVGGGLLLWSLLVRAAISRIVSGL
jgi:hypothetical protein